MKEATRTADSDYVPASINDLYCVDVVYLRGFYQVGMSRKLVVDINQVRVMVEC